MTSADHDSFMISALGNQTQSARHSAPSYSVSRTGRAQRELMYISDEHQRTTALCRTGPGHVYSMKDNFPEGAKYSIGKDKKRGLLDLKPEETPSNDLLCNQIDSQLFKYRRDSTILFGTEPKGELKSAELLVNHSAAFFGRQSPGPCNYKPDIEPTKPRLTPAHVFGEKTKPVGLKTGSTPEDVAPGCYGDVGARCVGKQVFTSNKNQAVNLFTKANRWKKDIGCRGQPISTLDAARSSFGKQALNRNRSEPSVGFGSSSRGHVDKTMRCMTSLDVGPVASMDRVVVKQPPLPLERTVMTNSFG